MKYPITNTLNPNTTKNIWSTHKFLLEGKNCYSQRNRLEYLVKKAVFLWEHNHGTR